MNITCIKQPTAFSHIKGLCQVPYKYKLYAKLNIIEVQLHHYKLHSHLQKKNDNYIDMLFYKFIHTLKIQNENKK